MQMRLGIRTGIAVVGVAVFLLVPAMNPALARGSSHPKTGEGPCPLERGSTETVQGFARRLIRCAVKRWSVPGGAAKAICIADHESGLVPSATSPTGLYRGLFQQSKNYWHGNFDSYTHHVWGLKGKALNGRSNAVVSIHMAHDPAVGWRPWSGVDC
jgi:hypothetical protein